MIANRDRGMHVYMYMSTMLCRLNIVVTFYFLKCMYIKPCACCVALLCCVSDLACFCLPSFFISLTCIYMYLNEQNEEVICAKMELAVIMIYATCMYVVNVYCTLHSKKKFMYRLSGL